jgi:hypothetical protein
MGSLRPSDLESNRQSKIVNRQFPMYHYDPKTALEELTEEAFLPNPVHVRDMILRAQLKPERSLEANRQFLEYQKHFGKAQRLGKAILEQLKG